MAIEKYHAESKEDLLSILQGMKDINDNPFFESVVMELLSGVYVIRFKEEIEGVATTVITWTVTGSSSNLGRVRVDYKNAKQSFNTILCPIQYPVDIYITRYGCLVDGYDGTYSAPTKKYSFGFAKTAAGSLIAIGSPNTFDYISSTTERQTIIICPDAPFASSAQSAAGVKDGQPMTFKDSHMEHKESYYSWSTLIELPVYSSNPMDHMDKAYLVFNNQTTLGEYGYFTYQGHTYLTNGFWAILDT